jgi:Domain of unknown function (DUF4861)
MNKLNNNIMKKNIFYLSIILLSTMISCDSFDPGSKFTLENPTDADRKDEIVRLDIKQLTEITGGFDDSQLPVFKLTGVWEDDQLPLFIYESDTLVSQFIDKDKNGSVDEVIIEADFAKNERKKVRMVLIPEDKYPSFPLKTNIHFAKKDDPKKEILTEKRLQSNTTEISSKIYQMEGPVWENDKVGFRNYFDLRNGMDIFGKTSKKMELDHVGLTESYHELADWGMDILKVGNSLGAGSIAILHKDSLYRVGDNGFGTYELLYEGPLESKFRFSFPDWKIADKTFKLTQDITITAGKFAYKSDVVLESNTNDYEVVTGIVNKHSDKAILSDVQKDFKLLLTHSKQAEDGSMLAMGILTPKACFKSNGETKNEGDGITETYYTVLKADDNSIISFYFYAIWARSDASFNDLDLVTKVIDNDAFRLENPILILP